MMPGCRRLRSSLTALALIGVFLPYPAPGAHAQSSQSAPRAPASDRAPVSVPAPSAKALLYYRSGNVVWGIDAAWGLMVPALLLFTGFSSRLRNAARRLGRRRLFVIMIYFVIFALLNAIIDLPLLWYEEFARPHAYGLSTQTLAKWYADSLKSLAVALVAGTLLLWIPYWLLARSPRRWWLYCGLLSVPFLFFATLISPIWIEPLFNRFGPMHDKRLERQILDLATRAEIDGSRVFEVDKSVDTREIDAYVTGFGRTKRIVLWDTLLAKLDGDEVLVVMAHEMGHYVLGHIASGILFGSALIMASLYAGWRLSEALIRRYRRRFGFDALSDVASLPLLVLMINLFSLLVSPAALAFSRHQEHEADRFALEITRSMIEK